MEKIYTIVIGLLLSPMLIAQQNITSVQDGNATNPFVWDCTCIPTPDDNITIAHDITMDVDWIVNNGGSITINGGATFIQDAQNRAILFDGSGSSFTNYGETELTNVAFTNGAEGHNHSSLALDTGLWIGPNSMFMNHGLTNVDSTLIQGMFMNEGTYGQGDFLNEGGTVMNTGFISVDSLYNNQGTINSSAGNITTNDFASNGLVNITGSSYMIINNDFLNAGTLNLAAGRDIRIGSDFLNASDADTAVIINDGLIEVGNDFSNIDTLRGSGTICIANNSSNTGDVIGTLDICDNTGTSIFDLNTGNVDATVTNCNSGCSVSVDENEAIEVSIYPNPVSKTLFVDGVTADQLSIKDVMGKEVYRSTMTNSVDVLHFKTGVYFITLQYKNRSETLKFIKN